VSPESANTTPGPRRGQGPAPSRELDFSRYLGPGLGLSLAKATVELHGGVLELNLPGDGSAVSATFILPQDANAVDPPLCGASVLVPSPGITSATEISAQLHELGAHVTEVDAGEPAFGLYPRWAVSGGERLMLWPLAPDALANIAAIVRIRRIEFEFGLPRIPVIALSSVSAAIGSRPNSARQLLEAGFDVELSLPKSTAYLLAVLAPLLGR
jgi:CheY-like chemotaxis protein